MCFPVYLPLGEWLSLRPYNQILSTKTRPEVEVSNGHINNKGILYLIKREFFGNSGKSLALCEP